MIVKRSAVRKIKTNVVVRISMSVLKNAEISVNQKKNAKNSAVMSAKQSTKKSQMTLTATNSSK